MRKLLTTALSLLFTIHVTASENNLKLWYDRPAKTWVSALPLGNGALGVMSYGGTATEELQLNEETLWGGSPHSNNSPKMLENLQKIRQLIFEGKNKEAQNLENKVMFTGTYGMPYQTIGSLLLDFDGHAAATDYYRDLDLSRAVATTRYKVGDVTFTRTLFTSYTKGGAVMRITADKPASVSFRLHYTSPMKDAKVHRQGCTLALSVDGYDHEKVLGVIKSETQTQVAAKGGKTIVGDTLISVSGADEAYVYIASATNFIDFQHVTGNQHKRCTEIMKRTRKDSFEQTLAEHEAFYRNLFNRVSLKLQESKEAQKPTDMRVAEFNTTSDPSLVTLMYQFGRYLLISSSQPGGQAANLQGIWNKDVAAPWDGKYTININLEMNYWPAEKTNLSEMHEPLLRLVKELSVQGAKTAKEMYDCRGWMAHHNTDIWRSAGAVDGAYWGGWPNGGGWLTTHLWQHYLYTGDRDFLREVYPVLKGSTQFYLDFLVEHPALHYMVTVPSTSPEHGPGGVDNPNVPSAQAGTTMDNQIVFDVFTQTLSAAQALDRDVAFQDSLRQMLSRLAPMQIGKYNQLQEWLADLDNPDDHHRHVSHLYGLYPSAQVSPFSQPQLFQAARNTLLQRGDEATGWSIGWKINLWARLLDGNHAYRIISNMLKLLPSYEEIGQHKDGRTLPNLFDAHPPFQIDGNFGFTSGVTEMLMQSHDGAVHLLPAVPDAWQTGEVTGLVARGGFVVDEQWDGCQLSQAKIHSRLGGQLRIRSYVPLKGEGLREAKGENTSTLFHVPSVAEPKINGGITPQYPILPKVYEYDIDTTAGHDYIVTRK